MAGGNQIQTPGRGFPPTLGSSRLGEVSAQHASPYSTRLDNVSTIDKRVFDVVETVANAGNACPTMRELAALAGLKSASSACRSIARLQSAGLLLSSKIGHRVEIEICGTGARTSRPSQSVAIDGDVARIALGNGRFALCDKADLDVLEQCHGFYLIGGYVVSRTLQGGHKKLHRLIMRAGPADTVDHVNGNPLDNRRANLRFATRRQNSANCRAKGGVSAFKGVTWTGDKWRARFQSTYGSKSLGLYDNEIAAALAYDAEARLQFGEFAALNFPSDGEQSAHRSAADWPGSVAPFHETTPTQEGNHEHA